jgi:uncharacterized membrane protein YhaH (DUF805 family)
MTFSDAIKTGFGKYSQFSGRARLSEYWWWVLFSILAQMIPYILFIAVVVGSEGTSSLTAVLGLLWFVVWAALIIPSLAVFVRRLHDSGKSGWFWLLGLIPLVGPIILIVFLVAAGDPGENQYGAPPV